MEPEPNFNIIHSTAKFGKNPIIRNYVHIAENCVFGDDVRISNYCNIDFECKIGSRVNMQNGVYLASGTVVGDDTFIAAHVAVADEKYPTTGPQIRKSTVIGKNCVIGQGSNLIGGITIGDGAVIGMGAAVVSDVPAGQVWVGNPARPLGRMDRIVYNYRKKEYEDAIKKDAGSSLEA